MASSSFRLSQASPSLKALVTCCLIGLSIGYLVSLAQIYNRSHFRKSEAIVHYRGSPDEDSLAVPQSDTSMISIAHVHTFTQPAILGMVGLMLVFTGLSERSKSFWIALSFLGSFAKNASPWLIRDISPHFMYLMYFGGGAMFLSFAVMAAAILREVWCEGSK